MIKFNGYSNTFLLGNPVSFEKYSSEDVFSCYGGFSVGIYKNKPKVILRGYYNIQNLGKIDKYLFRKDHFDIIGRIYPEIWFTSKKKAEEFLKRVGYVSYSEFDFDKEYNPDRTKELDDKRFKLYD